MNLLRIQLYQGDVEAEGGEGGAEVEEGGEAVDGQVSTHRHACTMFGNSFSCQ